MTCAQQTQNTTLHAVFLPCYSLRRYGASLTGNGMRANPSEIFAGFIGIFQSCICRLGTTVRTSRWGKYAEDNNCREQTWLAR